MINDFKNLFVINYVFEVAFVREKGEREREREREIVLKLISDFNDRTKHGIGITRDIPMLILHESNKGLCGIWD